MNWDSVTLVSDRRLRHGLPRLGRAAFVGLLLGGASPAEAAEVQLLVLVGLLAAETVAAVLTARLLGTWVGTTRPEPPG